jgi:hypothetical protein
MSRTYDSKRAPYRKHQPRELGLRRIFGFYYYKRHVQNTVARLSVMVVRRFLHASLTVVELSLERNFFRYCCYSLQKGLACNIAS